MADVKMTLPCAIECEECSRRFDAEYEVDLDDAARSGSSLLGRRELRRIADDVRMLAVEAGWRVELGHALCPECARRLEEAGQGPRLAPGNAREAVQDLRLALRGLRDRRA